MSIIDILLWSNNGSGGGYESGSNPIFATASIDHLHATSASIGTLTVHQEEVLSSSHYSGSNTFGDESTDVHDFIGTVNVNGQFQATSLETNIPSGRFGNDGDNTLFDYYGSMISNGNARVWKEYKLTLNTSSYYPCTIQTFPEFGNIPLIIFDNNTTTAIHNIFQAEGDYSEGQNVFLRIDWMPLNDNTGTVEFNATYTSANRTDSIPQNQMSIDYPTPATYSNSSFDVLDVSSSLIRRAKTNNSALAYSFNLYDTSFGSAEYEIDYELKGAIFPVPTSWNNVSYDSFEIEDGLISAAVTSGNGQAQTPDQYTFITGQLIWIEYELDLLTGNNPIFAIGFENVTLLNGINFGAIQINNDITDVLQIHATGPSEFNLRILNIYASEPLGTFYLGFGDPNSLEPSFIYPGNGTITIVNTYDPSRICLLTNGAADGSFSVTGVRKVGVIKQGLAVIDEPSKYIIKQTTIGPINVTNINMGGYIVLKLYRTPGKVDDSYDGDIAILNVSVLYLSNTIGSFAINDKWRP